MGGVSDAWDSWNHSAGASPDDSHNGGGDSQDWQKAPVEPQSDGSNGMMAGSTAIPKMQIHAVEALSQMRPKAIGVPTAVPPPVPTAQVQTPAGFGSGPVMVPPPPKMSEPIRPNMASAENGMQRSQHLASDEAHARIASLEAGMQQLRQRAEAADFYQSRAAMVESHVQKSNEERSLALSRANAAETRAGALEAEVMQARNHINASQQVFNQACQRAEVAESRLGAYEAEVKRLMDQIGSAMPRIEAAEAGKKELERELAKCRDQLATVQTVFAAVSQAASESVLAAKAVVEKMRFPMVESSTSSSPSGVCNTEFSETGASDSKRPRYD